MEGTLGEGVKEGHRSICWVGQWDWNWKNLVDWGEEKWQSQGKETWNTMATWGQGWRDLVLIFRALNGRNMVDLISTAPPKGVRDRPTGQRSCPTLPRRWGTLSLHSGQPIRWMNRWLNSHTYHGGRWVGGEKPKQASFSKLCPCLRLLLVTTYLLVSDYHTLVYLRESEINMIFGIEFQYLSVSHYLQHYAIYLILIISIWSDYNCPHALI